MIKEVRAYIKKQILEVDSDLKENKSAFYDEDLGESLIDRSFQIEINDISLNTRSQRLERTMPVVVSIFGFGYKDPITKYDELLDKALCISDNIVNLQTFNNTDFIINVNETSISSSNLTSDDNGFKIDINLSIEVAYIRE